MTDTVVIMAKGPLPGQVKTRLEPLLGPRGCARLQAELLRLVAATATDAGYRTVVAVAPPSSVPEVAGLLPTSVPCRPQRGDDLGERMAAAVHEVWTGPPDRVVVVGTDLPTLTAGTLDEAFHALDASDVVLGPALDGGYYLIGMRRPSADLFALDPSVWGGPEVRAATLRVAQRLGSTVHMLVPARDLDTPADAAVLMADAAVPAEIRQLLSPAEDPA